jgi:secreted Zn-dependent insulinase-like peptidase
VLKQILEGFTFEEFLDINAGWMKSGRLLWFVSGNMSKETAISLAEKTRKVFNLRPTEKEDLVDIRCISL